MKTIGLIGGMSWQSSIEYYRIINEESQKILGGFHTCYSIMYSVDIDPILKLQHEGKWDLLAKMMVDAAQKLERGGADFILICANTMHKTADVVEKNISIPLIHISDTTGEAIKAKKMKKVGLLGTPFTMQQDFYKERLDHKFGLDVIIPEDQKDRDFIYEVICKELDFGIINESSKVKFLEIIGKLVQRGAEGVVLGCTEIPLLVKQEDTKIPLFNTTRLHALEAVRLAL